jgi:neutral ceramidase
VIGVWNRDGKLAGCVVNFACHATTSPGGISANYVYYLEQAIRGFFGPQVVVVFLAGASGDVTQVNNLTQTANPQAERWAQLVGGRVGAEAVKVLLAMEPGTLAPVDSRNKTLSIKRRVPRPERVQQALETVAKDVKEVGATDWTFAKETVLLDYKLKKSPVAEVEVQVIQIGPVVLMANPAEYFCQFGLDMKSQSPFPLTFPVTFANDGIGYVPTEEAFGEHGGGYETRLTSYSNLEVTAGRQIVDAAVELARQLKPGEIPRPAKAGPFGAAWNYGNVPPQVE